MMESNHVYGPIKTLEVGKMEEPDDRVPAAGGGFKAGDSLKLLHRFVSPLDLQAAAEDSSGSAKNPLRFIANHCWIKSLCLGLFSLSDHSGAPYLP